MFDLLLSICKDGLAKTPALFRSFALKDAWRRRREEKKARNLCENFGNFRAELASRKAVFAKASPGLKSTPSAREAGKKEFPRPKIQKGVRSDGNGKNGVFWRDASNVSFRRPKKREAFLCRRLCESREFLPTLHPFTVYFA